MDRHSDGGNAERLQSSQQYLSSFFFSSRRRHTRSLRDWSSDVCSSDLTALGAFCASLPGGPLVILNVRSRRCAPTVPGRNTMTDTAQSGAPRAAVSFRWTRPHAALAARCLAAMFDATGSQGGAVARHLRRSGFTNVHALVRTADGSRARLLSEQGITLRVADLDDTESLGSALKDAYGVFSVLPLDTRGPDAEIARGRSVAEAAARADVEHFIYSSTGGANRSHGVAHFHTKYVVEQHVHQLGLPASIVRPSLFMENFTSFERPRLVDGVAVFRVPAHPQTPRQMIAVDDIGMVAADLFTRPET